MAGSVAVESGERPIVSADQIIAAKPGEFSDKLNAEAFVANHSLAGHPLFSLERLARLADFIRRERGEDRVYYRKAHTVPHTDAAWNGLTHISDVANVILRSEESGAWVAIHDLESDPEYNALIRKIVGQLSVSVGRDMLKDAVYIAGHLFIGSPNSVTNYHIDSETNFLCVIRGKKEFHLFDGSDRSLLRDQDIEKFYWGEIHAARRDASTSKNDRVFHLTPGECLHVPVNFPHWVQNGPESCIALSILVYLPENVERAHAYQMNRFLRLLGARPGPIGLDRARDRRRGWLFRALSTRNSDDKRDVINSGMRRFKAPFAFAKRVAVGWRRQG